MLGTQDRHEGSERWLASVGYRWFRSDRHFVGRDEQEDRTAESSQVVNDVHIMDFGLHYDISPRWTLSASFPFQMADRSNPLRDPTTDEVIGRTLTHATGFGDISVLARRWMLDPKKHERGNIKFGFGVKLPTGDPSVTDVRFRVDEDDLDGDGNITEFFPSVEHVDQSIMPGDGGFGLLLDFQSFYRFAKEHAAYYGSASYLINPQGENGVTRGTSATQTNSVTDFYVARTGVTWIPGTGHYGWSLGLRMEGTPWDDFIGSNAGFRRPGYSIGAEPGFSWSRGLNAVTFSAPIAIWRNRLKNEADRASGNHGDAAFADFSLIAGYFRRF